jgi:hypothetical protein
VPIPAPADNQPAEGGKMDLNQLVQQHWQLFTAAGVLLVFVVIFFTLAFSGATNTKFTNCITCRKLVPRKNRFCPHCGASTA